MFLTYATPQGHSVLDRELYLPQEWTNDEARCKRAGISPERTFATKPQLARQMLERAFNADVPAAWVTGDSVYGDNRSLRMWLEEQAQAYVLAVSGKEYVWQAGRQQQVKTLLTTLGAEGWCQLSAGDGAKGPRWYDWQWLPLAAPLQRVTMGAQPCELEGGVRGIVCGPAGRAGFARAHQRQGMDRAEDQTVVRTLGGDHGACVACEAEGHGWAVAPRAQCGDPGVNGLGGVHEPEARVLHSQPPGGTHRVWQPPRRYQQRQQMLRVIQASCVISQRVREWREGTGALTCCAGMRGSR